MGLGGIELDWLGFHIALKVIPFLSCWDGVAKARASGLNPNECVECRACLARRPRAATNRMSPLAVRVENFAAAIL
jgi:hypothetical protein